ncbi:MAG TPA: DUF3570 domain-containing protein [Polyangiaceae bacterium]
MASPARARRTKQPRLLAAFAALLAASVAPAGASAADDGTSAPAAAKGATGGKLQDASTKRLVLELASYADSDHVSIFTPSISGGVDNVTQGASLRGSYLVDVVSAASVDIVSTASKGFHEVRQAGALEFEYKPHDFGVTVGASTSVEPDYVSYGVGVAATLDLNERNTTLLLGYGYGHDTAGRSTTPFSVFSRVIEHGTLNAGLTQVVNRSTVASVAADLVLDDGDQSKPYRYIPMFDPAAAAKAPLGASIAWVTANRAAERPLEQLPLSRQRFAVTGRLGHRFEASTLRLEERVYADSWLLLASTSDVRWIFDLGRRFAFWPHARLHMQSGVDFWQRAYSTGSATGWDLPEFRTGDRELGPLRTLTGGGGLRVFLGSNADPQAWSLAFQADAMYTSFLDDLYLTERTGVIGSLTFEGEL